MMNKIFILILQVFCVTLANPVKRDGVQNQSSFSIFDPFDTIPLMISSLFPMSSESESEESFEVPIKTHDVPKEFPFHLAQALDRFFMLGQINSNTQRPLKIEDTATCPSTDTIIPTDKPTEKPVETAKAKADDKIAPAKPVDKVLIEKPRKFKKYSEKMLKKNPKNKKLNERLARKAAESRKTGKDTYNSKNKKDELEKNESFYGSDKKLIENEVFANSEEKKNLVKESIILKTVDGEPVGKTVILETVDKNGKKETEKTQGEPILIGEEDVAAIVQFEEKINALILRILNVLTGPYKFF